MRAKLRPDVAKEDVYRAFSHNLVTESDAAMITGCVGRACLVPASVLADALSEIARLYVLAANRVGRLSDASAAASARRVARAAKELLAALGVEDAEPLALYEHLAEGRLYAYAALDTGGGGRAAVSAAIVGVSNLRKWSRGVADQLERRVQAAKPKPSHVANAPFNQMIASLDRVYSGAFDNEPGSGGNNAGEIDGPFVRFMAAFVGHLAVQKIVYPRSKAALAKVWLRLPDEDKSRRADLQLVPDSDTTAAVTTL